MRIFLWKDKIKLMTNGTTIYVVTCATPLKCEELRSAKNRYLHARNQFKSCAASLHQCNRVPFAAADNPIEILRVNFGRRLIRFGRSECCALRINLLLQFQQHVSCRFSLYKGGFFLSTNNLQFFKEKKENYHNIKTQYFRIS